MAAVAHNPAFAKKVGIKQSVGEDFVAADKGKKFGLGGGVGITRGGAGQINKQQTRAGSIFGQQKEIPNVSLNKYIGKKEGGIMKHDDIKEDKALIKKAFGMHDKQLHESKKTDLTKLNKGGVMKETMGPRTMAKDVEAGANKLLKFGESVVQKRAHTKGQNLGDSGKILAPKQMAKGGSASSRADGMAAIGKTHGKIC